MLIFAQCVWVLDESLQYFKRADLGLAGPDGLCLFLVPFLTLLVLN